MKIYTKTGDTGQTSLVGGKRVDKHDARVTAYGCIDELNATIGWVMVPCPDIDLGNELRWIQGDLFVIGAELATEDDSDPPSALGAPGVERLESWLDRTWGQLPELRGFVLPGGGEFAARLHLARTVCRRAERAVVGLSRTHRVGESTIPYLNRLGDLLFAYARLANQFERIQEVVWIPPEKEA